MTTTSDDDRPLRADAERNRKRILAAAGELFAERGLDVSLDDVAAHAGVGVGTVYRRFPDRDALIDTLFEAKIDAVVAVAEAALEADDAFEGLRQFMFGVCRLAAEDRGLKETLVRTDRGKRILYGRNRIAPVATRVFARAREAGAIRSDLDGYDIPIMNQAIGFIAERTGEVRSDYWQRPLTVMLDGMRPAGHDCTPLPGAPLSTDEFQATMRSIKS